MGYKIREARKAQKMSQEELAVASGVSRTTISSIENSDGAYNVTMDTLRKLARALNKTIEAIFFEESV